MSPRSKAVSNRMKAESRKAILAASLELFAKHGYSATTTDAIARKAGVSKGLIFVYFPTKQRILTTILDEQIERLSPILGGPEDARPPAEKLAALITTWVEVIRSEPLLNRLSMQLNLDEEFHKIMKKKGKQYIEQAFARMRNVFAQLGSPSPDLDCFLLGFCFDGISANYTVAPELIPLDAIRDHLIAMFLSRSEQHQ